MTEHAPSGAGEFGGLVAAVTGGASGIGLATAAEFARRGARVCVLDLNANSLPYGLRGIVCDVRDRTSVTEALAALDQRFGRLDILVNNAGIGVLGTVEDNDDLEWARVLDVNVTGVGRVSAAALPLLRRAAVERPGCTAIVNTCSITATAGLPRRALYSASKGAVLALTRAMAADHIHDGIRVNCVNPGTVDTPWIARLLAVAPDPEAERAALAARQPNGRLVSAQEVAVAICYLAGPYAGATTGMALAVDGGMYGLRLPPAGPTESAGLEGGQ